MSAVSSTARRGPPARRRRAIARAASATSWRAMPAAKRARSIHAALVPAERRPRRGITARATSRACETRRDSRLERRTTLDRGMGVGHYRRPSPLFKSRPGGTALVSPAALGWIVFAVLILGMLALDLFVLRRRAHAVGMREALAWSGVWIGLALLFNLGVLIVRGHQPALEFLTAYLIEE